MLCSRSLLVIHVKYSSVYMSVPNSSWIAPYPCKESLPDSTPLLLGPTRSPRLGALEVPSVLRLDWPPSLCLSSESLKFSRKNLVTFCSQLSLLIRAPNQSLTGKKGADTMLFSVSSLIILSRQVKQKSCSSFCQKTKLKPNQTKTIPILSSLT